MGLSPFDEGNDPSDRLIKDRCLKGIYDELAVAPRRDQVRLLEQVQVIGDARLAHPEGVGDFPRVQVPLLEHLQYAAARWVLKRFEEKVHRMLKDLDKYLIIINRNPRARQGGPSRDGAHGAPPGGHFASRARSPDRSERSPSVSANAKARCAMEAASSVYPSLL